MAWMRVSDTAATYPALLEVAEHPDADERSVDEVFGFWMRCAAQSAQHPHATDYIVTMATAITIAGTRPRADQLIGMAAFAGLLSVVEDTETGRRALRLLNDPEFVHIKTGDELAWEKQRRMDNGNPAITVPVRLRDGDACRYCGIVVRFTARRGQLAGTYDHRPPGQPGSPETSVVACATCNGRRGNQPLDVADAALPLMPPPTEPYYHRETRKWLQGYAALLAERGETPPPLAPDTVKDVKVGTPLRTPERQDPAPTQHGVRPTAAPAGAHNGTPTHDDPPPALAGPPDGVLTDPGRTGQVAGVRQTETPGRDGTGRDGPGRDGTGRAGLARSADRPDLDAPPTGQPPARRKRRGRRGGRPRPTTPDERND